MNEFTLKCSFFFAFPYLELTETLVEKIIFKYEFFSVFQYPQLLTNGSLRKLAKILVFLERRTNQILCFVNFEILI